MEKCIFSGNNDIEILQIKELLENNGIITYVKNLHIQNLLGATKMFTGIDLLADNIEIYVSEHDADNAIALLNDKNNTSNNEYEEFIEDEIHDVSEKNNDDKINDYDKSILGKSFYLSFLSFFITPLFFNIEYLIHLWKNKKNIAVVYSIITIISMSFTILGILLHLEIFYRVLFIGLFILVPILCSIKSIVIYMKNKSIVSIIYLFIAIIIIFAFLIINRISGNYLLIILLGHFGDLKNTSP
jgi:hypothetical protein